MISVNNLTKSFSTDFKLNINELHINNAECVALIGANGSGKSTLLRLIAGAVKRDSGEIKTECENINDIYYQPQQPFILNSTVYDNISLGFGGNKNSIGKAERKGQILEAAEKCELSDMLKKRAYLLSGGEKQRMCFSRLLLKPRKLLLLDEPFSAMDIEIAKKAEELLLDFCKKNISTLILCTHLPSQAMNVCERMIIMHNGEIAEDGKTTELFKNPQTNWGKKFISQWRLE